jgi:Tol biopolymer transport system component
VITCSTASWQALGIAYVPAEGGDVTRIPLRSDVNIRLQGYGTGNRVSPDGRTIVFAGHKSQAPIDTMHIWTLAVEGGTPRQLTEAPAPFRDSLPSWSPDGRHIVFVRSKPPDNWNAVGESNIYEIPVAGGEPRQITSESDRVFSVGTVLWSPDAKSLAFSSRDVGSVDGTIKVIPAEGGPPRIVAKVTKVFANTEMAWSPDARRVAYNAPGNKIVIVTLDGGGTVEIEPDLKGVKQTYHLGWSPDGKTLVFGGAVGGDPEIWTISNFLPATKR